MTDINLIVLCGRLTRDCGSDPNGKDFQYTQGGMCIARISIAVNRSKKQTDGSYADEANFFDVTIFGNMAQNLKPYLVKGKQIVVHGHLKQERWQDQQGNNRSKLGIVAEEIQLIGGQSQNGNGQNLNQQGYNPQTVYPTAQAAQQASTQQNPQQYAPPQGYQQQPNFGQAPQNQYQPQQNFPPPSEGGFPEDIPWNDSIPF